jgi:antitoxin component YwqK of YwqJK toxin-antitoxin module
MGQTIENGSTMKDSVKLDYIPDSEDPFAQQPATYSERKVPTLDSNGFLIHLDAFKNNELVYSKDFYEGCLGCEEEQAVIKKITNYNNDSKHGEWKSFYRNGKLMGWGHYKEGLPDGRWTYYNILGAPVGEGAFQNGKGHWKKNRDNGTLFESVTVDEDFPLVRWSGFSETGGSVGSVIIDDVLENIFIGSPDFPVIAFKACVVNTFFVDSVIEFGQLVLEPGKRIPKQNPVRLINTRSPSDDSGLCSALLNSIEIATNGFTAIRFNYQYEIEFESSPATGHDYDRWVIVFLDKYRYKIEYNYNVGRVSAGESSFYYDRLKNRSNIKIATSDCGLDFEQGGRGCGGTTIAINDGVVRSVTYD